jgi:hypothetical protein
MLELWCTISFSISEQTKAQRQEICNWNLNEDCLEPLDYQKLLRKQESMFYMLVQKTFPPLSSRSPRPKICFPFNPSASAI